MQRDQDFPISIEVQFLGGLSDGNARPTGNVCSPGHANRLRRRSPTRRIAFESRLPTIDGDSWVTADVLVIGDERVVHYIDGLPVIEYGGDHATAAATSPATIPRNKPDGAAARHAATIALQSESHPIEFRRVELLEPRGPLRLV